MKNIYLLLIICLFTNCNDDFDLKSETENNIDLIKSNHKHLKELIEISNELYIRNINKKLSVTIVNSGEIQCNQELNRTTTNYCVGSNWNCKDIKLENSFRQQIHLDSITLIAMRSKMNENKILRTELNNNIIEFLFSENNFCTILYDLNVKLKPQDELDLEVPINIDNIIEITVISVIAPPA